MINNYIEIKYLITPTRNGNEWILNKSMKTACFLKKYYAINTVLFGKHLNSYFRNVFDK